MRNEKEDIFLEKIKQSLDENAGSLDGRIRSRLNQSRQQAVSEWQDGGRVNFNYWWKSLAGVAAAGVIFVALTQSPRHQELPSDIAKDSEILFSTEQISFYEELDFYSWLAQEAENAG